MHSTTPCWSNGAFARLAGRHVWHIAIAVLSLSDTPRFPSDLFPPHEPHAIVYPIANISSAPIFSTPDGSRPSGPMKPRLLAPIPIFASLHPDEHSPILLVPM